MSDARCSAPVLQLAIIRLQRLAAVKVDRSYVKRQPLFNSRNPKIGRWPPHPAVAELAVATLDRGPSNASAASSRRISAASVIEGLAIDMLA
jgi:hypothetical protein